MRNSREKLCCLLQEVHRARYVKFSGTTVIVQLIISESPIAATRDSSPDHCIGGWIYMCQDHQHFSSAACWNFIAPNSFKICRKISTSRKLHLCIVLVFDSQLRDKVQSFGEMRDLEFIQDRFVTPFPLFLSWIRFSPFKNTYHTFRGKII